jgi:hypothetical protein
MASIDEDLAAIRARRAAAVAAVASQPAKRTIEDDLAAIRAKRASAAPAIPAPAPKRVRTNELAASGLTGAEVKRRAAAGEPIVQEGARTGSDAEQLGTYLTDFATGVVKGTAEMGGLAVDAVRNQALLAKGIVTGKPPTVQELTALPATRAAGEAVLRGSEAFKEKVGLSGVEIGPAGVLAELGGELVAPGPEVAMAGKFARSVGMGRISDVVNASIDAAKTTHPKAAKILEYAIENKGIGVDDLASKFGLTKREVDGFLDFLRQQDFLHEAIPGSRFILREERLTDAVLSAGARADTPTAATSAAARGGRSELVRDGAERLTSPQLEAARAEVPESGIGVVHDGSAINNPDPAGKTLVRPEYTRPEFVRPTSLPLEAGRRGDTVRLYRAEPVDPTVDLPSKDLTSTPDLDALARAKVRGSWYTADRKQAMGYKDDIQALGHDAQIRAVDVPADQVDNYLAAKHPTASNHATDLDKDYFLPAEARAGSVVEAQPPATNLADDLDAQIGVLNDRAAKLFQQADEATEPATRASLEAEGYKLADESDALLRQRDDALLVDQAGAGQAAARARPAGVRAPEQTEPDFVTDELAGKRGEPPSDTPPGGGGPFGDGDLPKYARPSSINLQRLNIGDDAKINIIETAQSIAPDLEARVGRPLTHDEVIDAAAQSQVLRSGVTRAETEKLAAEILRSSQDLAAMAESGKVTREYVDRLRDLSTTKTHVGRLLNSMAIHSDPILARAQDDLITRLDEMGKTTDEIVEALEGVDFNDPAQATRAFQMHVKPRLAGLLDAYRYTNLLSSPKTHIVNAFSNMLQTVVVRPADRLASGAVDWFGSKLTGKARTTYSGVTPYYRGVANAWKPAVEAFTDAMTGKVGVGQLDLAKVQAEAALPAPLKVIPRLLEGMDRFTMKLVEGGEFEAAAAAAKKSGRPFNEVEAAKSATATAKEVAFRKELDPTNLSGHGALLSKVDELTGKVQHLLNTNVGGVQPLRWVVPFVQTPMNIFKQGIEHSPLGFATAIGSTRKTEQLGKAIVGSTVFLGAGLMAMDDRTTWAAPRDPKKRAAYFNVAKLQPYSLRLGDGMWISYTKLGPIAYPIALAAAMKHQTQDHPDATGKLNVAATGRILGSLAEFFGDQSYMQGIGDLFDAFKGNAGVIARLTSNSASQLIPLASLQRWVTQIVDPVYRQHRFKKGEPRLSLDVIIDNLKRGIPGLSTSVDPQLTPSGDISERQMPMLNAFSPVGVTVEQREAVRRMRRQQAEARKRNAAK